MNPDYKEMPESCDRGVSPLYIFGVPGSIGGASTKIAHLIKLLHKVLPITLVLPDRASAKNPILHKFTAPFNVPCVSLNDLPKRLDAVALAICIPEFFSGGTACEIKTRGFRLVWSNEMMFPFKGEAEAARAGLIDRVLFVSEFQADAFKDIYSNTASRISGNYIDPDVYQPIDRRNPTFTIGRLSRADVAKYPLNFPIFYEQFNLDDVRYRVMAWSPELQKQYRWHKFGSEWELLPANKEPVLKFLHTLDAFVYPLGHRVKESWGRAVVEAMLTGCIPVVPTGHQFEKMLVHGKSGFVCREYREFRAIVGELYGNCRLRKEVSEQSSLHARNTLCNPDEHRKLWIEALSL
jgi:hypothetical protein